MLFIANLIQAKVRHRAVKGAGKFFSQGHGSPTQFVSEFLPTATQSALLCQIAFVLVETVANFFQDLFGRRLLARIGSLVENAIGLIANRIIAANIASLGSQAMRLIREFVACYRGKQAQ